ncbi:MAG: phosphatase PAP2 family protein [Gemmatimonadota bacterium]
MSDNPGAPPGPPLTDRISAPRGLLSAARDALYSILRFIARHVRGFWAAIVAFLTIGLAVGAAATAVFAGFAAAVESGFTQALDERALHWFEARRSPLLDEIMLEVTSLGNGAVLVMLVAVTSVFLWLTHHRWSVYILLVGVFGGKILNNVLKVSFGRNRPDMIEWADHVSSKSFPSGHAMAAIIAYGSVAYLVSRLEPAPRLRAATWLVAGMIILAIGISRLYLGVHYPSDVIGGFLAGLAWLAFVASSVAALRFFAPRRPQTETEEQDLHAEEEREVGIRE